MARPDPKAIVTTPKHTARPLHPAPVVDHLSILFCGGCGGSAAYRSSVPRQQARFTIVSGTLSTKRPSPGGRGFSGTCRDRYCPPKSCGWNVTPMKHWSITATSHTAGPHSAVERQLRYVKSIAARHSAGPLPVFLHSSAGNSQPGHAVKLVPDQCLMRLYSGNRSHSMTTPNTIITAAKQDALTFLRGLRNERSTVPGCCTAPTNRVCTSAA